MPFEHLKDEEKSLDVNGIELNGKYATAELSSLNKGHDIIRFAKAQRIRWLGQVEGMSEKRTPIRMLKGRLFSRRKEGTNMYKISGQCGDGDQRLEKKCRGQSRLEENCEGSQSPQSSVVVVLVVMVLLLLLLVMMIYGILTNFERTANVRSLFFINLHQYRKCWPTEEKNFISLTEDHCSYLCHVSVVTI